MIFLAKLLTSSIEKLLKRHGGFSEISESLHNAWECFIQSLVNMMFEKEETDETETPKNASPSTTPTLMRRAVLRKRSGTVGQIPITRSSSESHKNERLPQPMNINLDSPRGRRKPENSPKLFRARSITFKKKRKVNATSINFTDTTRIITMAKETWNTILQPHWHLIVSSLFSDLQKVESFEFAHTLLGKK